MRKMSLDRRVRTLERKINGAEITCLMADGSQRRVRARRLREMLGEIGRDDLSADTRALLECVRDNCQATRYGHMGQLLRVIACARQSAERLSSEERARIEASE